MRWQRMVRYARRICILISIVLAIRVLRMLLRRRAGLVRGLESKIAPRASL